MEAGALKRHIGPAGCVLPPQRDELLRALGSAIEGLVCEADEVHELAAKVEPQLRKLAVAWDI
jgi:hypothetical protein